jgi:predicted phosphodiesterase
VRLEPASIGIISDLHGNDIALRAVIDDGEATGIDRWIVLGDMVAMGPRPSEVLDLLDGLDIVFALGGNTERYVLSNDRPDPTLDDVVADPAELPRLVEVVATFAWTRGYLAASDRLAQLALLPTFARCSFPDGSELLAVHASQIADDGEGIQPDLGDEAVRRLFPDARADVVIGGHTHRRTDIIIDGVRFVNPGSVSNHDVPDLDATYTVLHLSDDGHRFEHRDVAYDKAAAVEAISEANIPGAGFLLRRYFGRPSE